MLGHAPNDQQGVISIDNIRVVLPDVGKRDGSEASYYELWIKRQTDYAHFSTKFGFTASKNQTRWCPIG